MTLIYIDTNRQEQADAAYQQLLAGFSGHKDIAQAVYQIAREYYELKKYEKADPIYKYVLDTWPEDTYAIWSQADLVKLNIVFGNEDAANAAVKKLLATASTHKDTAKAVYQVARKYYDLKKYEKAEPVYKYVLDTWPEDKYAVWSQADLVKLNILFGNEAADAAEYFELFLQKSPNDPRVPGVLYDLGRAYEKMGELRLAAEMYRIFIEMADPNDLRIKTVKAGLEKLEGPTK